MYTQTQVLSRPTHARVKVTVVRRAMLRMLGSRGPPTEPEPVCILPSGNHADALSVKDGRWAPGPQRAGEETLVVRRRRGCQARGGEGEGLSNRGTEPGPAHGPALGRSGTLKGGPRERGWRGGGGGADGWGRAAAEPGALGRAGYPEAPKPRSPEHWVRSPRLASERSAPQRHGVWPPGDDF